MSTLSPARQTGSTPWGLLAALACLPVLLLLASLCMHRADASKTPDWKKDQLTYLPSGKLLKPMTVGFETAAASLLWVKGVLYFGDAFLTGNGYQWMGHMLDIVTTLNPRFKEAYNFGASMLTRDKDEIPATLRLIDRGLAQYPREWQWRVSAALARVRLDSNYVAAAEYLKSVAGDISAPQYVRLLVATFAEKGGNERMAIAYLADRYRQSTTPMEREIFIQRLAKIDLRDTSATRKGISHAEKSHTLRLILDSSKHASNEALVEVVFEILAERPSPVTLRLLESLGALKTSTPNR